MNLETHGCIDYGMGLLLIFSPSLFVLPVGVPVVVVLALGLFIGLYSLLTRYNLGVLPWISMKLHFTLDILTGLFLGASPWIFGFADSVFWPFVVLGAIRIGSVIFTAIIHLNPITVRDMNGVY
ncbi:MAG: hypothetical protein H0X63_12715 [Flavobacteriales bacterium]|nr:hypothetical protein [Flavobacteriales bacterium]